MHVSARRRHVRQGLSGFAGGSGKDSIVVRDERSYCGVRARVDILLLCEQRGIFEIATSRSRVITTITRVYTSRRPRSARETQVRTRMPQMTFDGQRAKKTRRGTRRVCRLPRPSQDAGQRFGRHALPARLKRNNVRDRRNRKESNNAHSPRFTYTSAPARTGKREGTGGFDRKSHIAFYWVGYMLPTGLFLLCSFLRVPFFFFFLYPPFVSTVLPLTVSRFGRPSFEYTQSKL